MPCEFCDDTGWKPVDEDGVRRVVRCDCNRAEAGQLRLASANIPRRYQHCTIANFTAYNESLKKAAAMAGRLAQEFPAVGRGLFMTEQPACPPPVKTSIKYAGSAPDWYGTAVAQGGRHGGPIRWPRAPVTPAYNLYEPSGGHGPSNQRSTMSFFSRPAAPQIDTPPPSDVALAPNTLIGLRNLEKSYAHGTSRTYVLRRINLDVKEGEFISIMGPSGAGKSTLLHIVGMHDSAWTGEYYFLDQPVHKLGAKDRGKLHKQYIGFVFQSYHLLDHLTVYENLDIPLSYRDIKKSERESMVCDILDKFAIVGKKDLYPNQLSGGQQQLVAVARAVISNPKVILADEPTGNLHTSQGREIMELFRKLNETGTTIIQVTHSEANAAYGTRIIQLRDGWVVEG